jgi:aspartyl-tRNA(Asn)/glutamyl-tRNA(Gln) amidotransferase subunit A
VSVSSVTINRQPICRSIRETRQLFLGGHSTVGEHVQDVLAAIDVSDPWLRAFVAVAGSRALQEAQAADLRIASRGEAAFRDRPLPGVTVSVKDLIQTQGLATSGGAVGRIEEDLGLVMVPPGQPTKGE